MKRDKKKIDVEEWIDSWPEWERRAAYAILNRELSHPIEDALEADKVSSEEA